MVDNTVLMEWPAQIHNARKDAPAREDKPHIACTVHFLDDSLHEFHIEKNSIGQRLLDLVYDHLKLTERDFFGLQFISLLNSNTARMRWLDAKKSLKRQIICAPFQLFFRVKFFTPEPECVRDMRARHLIYLQIRKDFLDGKFYNSCDNFELIFILASFAAQYELGDSPSDSENHLDEDYLRDFKFLPHHPADFERRVARLHFAQRGLSRADAQFNFCLYAAKRISLYGFDLYNAKDGNGRSILIGINFEGISVLDDIVIVNRFTWNVILKLSFKRKTFYLRIRKPTSIEPNNDVTEWEELELSFNAICTRNCKMLWKSCTEHHAFFRGSFSNAKISNGVKSSIQHGPFSRLLAFRHKGTKRQLTSSSTKVKNNIESKKNNPADSVSSTIDNGNNSNDERDVDDNDEASISGSTTTCAKDSKPDEGDFEVENQARKETGNEDEKAEADADELDSETTTAVNSCCFSDFNADQSETNQFDVPPHHNDNNHLSASYHMELDERNGYDTRPSDELMIRSAICASAESMRADDEYARVARHLEANARLLSSYTASYHSDALDYGLIDEFGAMASAAQPSKGYQLSVDELTAFLSMPTSSTSGVSTHFDSNSTSSIVARQTLLTQPYIPSPAPISQQNGHVFDFEHLSAKQDKSSDRFVETTTKISSKQNENNKCDKKIIGPSATISPQRRRHSMTLLSPTPLPGTTTSLVTRKSQARTPQRARQGAECATTTASASNLPPAPFASARPRSDQFPNNNNNNRINCFSGIVQNGNHRLATDESGSWPRRVPPPSPAAANAPAKRPPNIIFVVPVSAIQAANTKPNTNGTILPIVNTHRFSTSSNSSMSSGSAADSTAGSTGTAGAAARLPSPMRISPCGTLPLIVRQAGPTAGSSPPIAGRHMPVSLQLANAVPVTAAAASSSSDSQPLVGFLIPAGDTASILQLNRPSANEPQPNGIGIARSSHENCATVERNTVNYDEYANNNVPAFAASSSSSSLVNGSAPRASPSASTCSAESTAGGGVARLMENGTSTMGRHKKLSQANGTQRIRTAQKLPQISNVHLIPPSQHRRTHPQQQQQQQQKRSNRIEDPYSPSTVTVTTTKVSPTVNNNNNSRLRYNGNVALANGNGIQMHVQNGALDMSTVHNAQSHFQQQTPVIFCTSTASMSAALPKRSPTGNATNPIDVVDARRSSASPSSLTRRATRQTAQNGMATQTATSSLNTGGLATKTATMSASNEASVMTKLSEKPSAANLKQQNSLTKRNEINNNNNSYSKMPATAAQKSCVALSPKLLTLDASTLAAAQVQTITQSLNEIIANGKQCAAVDEKFCGRPIADQLITTQNMMATNEMEGTVSVRLSADMLRRANIRVTGGSDCAHPAIVRRIAAGGASVALNEGDQLLRVNGHDIGRWTHAEVGALLQQLHEGVGDVNFTIRPNVYRCVSLTNDMEDAENRAPKCGSAAADGGGGYGTTANDALRVADTVPRSDKLAESMAILKRALVDDCAPALFEQVYRKRPGLSMDAAHHAENMAKNRYRDVCPYDATRVKLRNAPSGDYINANHVNMHIQSSGIVNRYIATQGPLPHTTIDFWWMVWEQSTTTIVMLTTLAENGRVKCHQYWPEPSARYDCGNLELIAIAERIRPHGHYREICVRHKVSREQRRVTQMQYTAWPDHGVPDNSEHFIQFVDEVRAVRQGSIEPIVVHCSAGIGRTGVLIMMETAVCMIEANEPVYPLDIMRAMRDQRAMLVQTVEQFKFICLAILRAFDGNNVAPLAEYQRANYAHHIDKPSNNGGVVSFS